MHTDPTPLVSIIVPCYNQALFLNETLQSIFDQTYKKWECIIVNDGSTDATEEVIKRWTEKDSRYKYFKKSNSGVSDTRNYGMERAMGSYIQFLDADDLIEPNKLKISIDSILEADVDIVCSNYKMLSEVGKYLPPFSQLSQYEFTFENIVRYWNNGFTVPIHCWFFTRESIGNLRFPVGLDAQEDWVLWIKILGRGPIVKYVNQALAVYRIHSSSRTQQKDFFDETLQAINFLKNDFNESQFRLVYESVLWRYNESSKYWQYRAQSLKKSRSFITGYVLKRFLRKIKCLHLARKFFDFIKLKG